MKPSPGIVRASSWSPCLSALSAAMLLVAACGSSPPARAPEEPVAAAPPGASAPATPPGPMSLAAPEASSSEAAPAVCDLVCERAQVAERPNDEPDYRVKVTEDANRVIASMQGDLLACYKTRLKVNPAAHGFITVDLIVGPDGHVQSVETTGGAVLGETTMGCIVDRLKAATFTRPHGGGTQRVSVPFSLRRVAPGDET